MTGRRKIRVLAAADGAAERELLRALLEGPAIDVVGTSAGGEDAVARAVGLRPDVVTLEVASSSDIEAIERLMLVSPTRVVAVTAAEPGGPIARRVLAAGALELVGAPPAWTGEPARRWASHLAETIVLMAEVPVVTRRAGVTPPVASRVIDAIGIAASTGGPPVLAEVLRPLRGRTFPPILIVQHLGQGFTGGLVRWLGEQTGLPAVTASHGTALEPGALHFAPDSRDLVVEGDRLAVPPLAGLHQPCADRMFSSLAAAYGRRAVGIVLTGMGDDGARGLRAIRDAGGLAIAQDPQTCVLGGMPGAAIEADAAELVLPPHAIAAALFALSRA